MHADATQSVATTSTRACSSAEKFLERWIGLDPQIVGSNAIAHAVRVRMEARGESDEETFLARLARGSGIARGVLVLPRRRRGSAAAHCWKNKKECRRC